MMAYIMSGQEHSTVQEPITFQLPKLVRYKITLIIRQALYLGRTNSLISTCSKQHIKAIFAIVGICKMYLAGKW